MNIRTTSLLASLLLGLALPAAAESFASSASSAGSASVGSLSDSVGKSSDSSSKRTAAAGEYRVVAVAAAPGDRQHYQLQAVDDASQGFTLMLPQAAAALQLGERIAVQDRPYGLAFARAGAAEPFFVALADDWQRELELRRVPV